MLSQSFSYVYLSLLNIFYFHYNNNPRFIQSGDFLKRNKFLNYFSLYIKYILVNTGFYRRYNCILCIFSRILFYT